MKIHESSDGIIIGICDSELLGKKFEESDLVLDVSTSFYKGKIASMPAIIRALKLCLTANVVGNKIVTVLLKKGILKGQNIKSVKGIKYAHFYRV